MADAAEALRSIAIELSEAEYVWLEARARQDGVSPEQVVSAVLREVRTRESQREQARSRMLEYLGDAAEVSPDDEAAILREIRGTE